VREEAKGIFFVEKITEETWNEDILGEEYPIWGIFAN
jgi:hypothetical protein